ncbi:PaaX family transcriptional regulator [Defluviimonas denitrificans]|uniref:PaaX family transcriptional regulator n=1 Tax=Albidovulum denitrificans TaxID=404881 RepID=A0A2S8RZ40_9RHOB|nr:PaaX family transcriptional regulator C-terminal domain-containing protein [Defluviimonas denitrificans]PQV53799.1 PaaX family transcriptional regulator [Defluviimonas denitrificans]
MAEEPLVTAVLKDLDVRAASFIVTIYGDVVVPRGGVLWTGTLIEICDRVGINESLVRTAVSRLVAANRLRGERVGRHSYYRLDASAQREFDQAAGLLYAPEVPGSGWQILHAPGLSPDDAWRQRMGHMGGSVFIRPDRGQTPPDGAMCFHADDPADVAQVAQFWDLTALDARYADFLSRFSPVAAAGRLSDECSLVLRLLLVHAFRGVVLRDPRLPAVALPPDWKGHAARSLFRMLYLRLTPPAEGWIGARFEGAGGRLPDQTPISIGRLQSLS